MKKAMLLGVLLAAVTFVPSSAEAGKFNRRTTTYRTNQGYVQSRPARKGPLARLWELEKRKNAWLKRTFLNR